MFSNIIFTIVPKSLLIYPSVARKLSHATGEFICPNLVKGMDYIKDSRLYKGLAFSREERQALGLQGILGAAVCTQEEQLAICHYAIDRYKDNLNKYLYLTELHDTNQRLFFSLLNTDIEKFLPIVYTPTVGLACLKFGLAYRRPQGLYITIHDRHHVMSVLNNWPEQDIRAICFTDGERILGLGDLGAYGMGIPIGKLALYTALAGIKPHQCLPITLDVGTNNQKLLEDPLYVGLRQKRVDGKEYFDFIDEFMEACTKKYGSDAILQFEDFALHHATPLLAKYKDTYCTFNDDIQGTASVACAGLLTALRMTKTKMSDHKYLFMGAGSAATGIGHLIVEDMKQDGVSEKEAYDKIYMFDIDGLVTTKRKSGVPPAAEKFGKDLEPETSLEKLVEKIKPWCLVGASTVGGAFTPAILKMMGEINERPVIFALSNPTPKAECTAQQAYDATDARCIFASGSPFPPVQHKGKTYHTGQGNNAYIFPGVALGVIASGSTLIPDSYFLTAARTLATVVNQKDLDLGRIYPPLGEIRSISSTIALEVCKEAYKLELATMYPKPRDLLAHISSITYDLKYPSSLPQFYKYPASSESVKVKSIAEAYGKGEGRSVTYE